MTRHTLPGIVWTIALAAAVFATYWPGLGGGFVFDDYPNIVDNTRLHVGSLQWSEWAGAAFSSDAGPASRPLAMLSFAAQHFLTGLDPWWMKLANVALHALNALLVLALAGKLLGLAAGQASPTRRAWTARFAAAAWALHPINLMPVLFVVQRMESLSHSFVFAGLWLYLHGRQRQFDGRNGWPWILAGLVGGTALGLLAKESAVLLPLYAFLVELVLRMSGPVARDRAHWLDRRVLALFAVVLFVPAALGLAWLLPQMLAPAVWAGRDFTLAERLLTELRVVVNYLRWIVLPDIGELSLYHDDYPVSRGWLQPWTTLASTLVLAALAALAWAVRRRAPLVALGIAWFLSAHLLTATFIPFELVYEHRNYFASLGICLAAGAMLLLVPAGVLRRTGPLVAVLAVLVLAGLTHLRAREWSDPYRFAASEAAKHPQSPRATYAYAKLLADASGYDPESPLFAPAIEELEHARRVPGSGILPHSGLLLLAQAAGRPADPVLWTEMQARLRDGPIGPQETGALGGLARCARDGDCRFPEGALEASYAAALQGGPNAELYAQLADYRLNVEGNMAGALALARKAVAMQPRSAQYRINLVRMLIAAGQREAAQHEIAALRATGRAGSHEHEARALEERLRTWGKGRP
jgi:protein O-mannosyl-transferase